MLMPDTPSDIHESAFAGDYRQLKKHLDENAQSPNVKDDVGQTPLHKAAMNGWMDCVQLLLDKGSLVNNSDVAGCTALHYAASNGYLEIAKYLVEKGHANMTHKTNKGHTPRYMAKSRGQTRLVALFNELENKLDGHTWLS